MSEYLNKDHLTAGAGRDLFGRARAFASGGEAGGQVVSF